MQNKLRYVFAVFVLGFVHLAAEELRDAVECHPRQGLPHVVAKLEAGQPVKVAYLGGSITAAPGWRVQSRAWLKEQYPGGEIEEIHAAIGGTGSDLGVFRVGRDALRHQPDLLFVEFAVNDGGADPVRIHKAMEGIVRQTWKANPKTDICFVYTLTDKMLEDLDAGKMPRAASAMEVLADHYGIPSIHFGVKVAALVKAGELVFKAEKPKDPATAKPMVFSSDGVHPLVETGHVLYTETISRSWPAIRAAGKSKEPHALGAPLRADNWEAAKLVDIRPDMLTGPWKKLPNDTGLGQRFSRNLPDLYQAMEPGASLSFAYTGISASVFDLLGPDGGQLSVVVDGGDSVTRNRIDGYCTYHRMASLSLLSEGAPGRHTVVVTLTAETLDKEKILFERNRKDLADHPDKYTDHVWHAGCLMIIGEVE
ncbi:MAG: hypothetical protein ACI9TH_004169 [Kiritimatiellia bacterium]|jgi:hypothetical protein